MLPNKQPQNPLTPPKAPAFGQNSGQNSGQMINVQAPAVNKGTLLAGLTQAAQYKPNTGSAGGNRAVSDYAKGLAGQNIASASRSISQQNAQTMAQRQQANEQLYEASRANQLARYKQAVQQSMGNSDLANQMAMWRSDMATNWQNFAMGLLG
jgi:hypothetical protein